MYQSDYLKNLIYWLQHKYNALYIIQTIILQITLYVLAKINGKSLKEQYEKCIQQNGNKMEYFIVRYVMVELCMFIF